VLEKAPAPLAKDCALPRQLPPHFPHTPLGDAGGPRGPRPRQPAQRLQEVAGIAGIAAIEAEQQAYRPGSALVHRARQIGRLTAAPLL
jgi:hypothetical protein